MKNNRMPIAILLFLLFFTLPADAQKKERKILYYRDPMNPKITSQAPAKDPMGMDYLPVYEEETASEFGSSAGIQVNLNARDVELAGVVSEPVNSLHLFKDIRTVGKVAYDPQLYQSEEEFIQALVAKEALQKSSAEEVKIRSTRLVDASRLKLRLLGLSEAQIDELAKIRQPDRSLIISDGLNPSVWIYADIYESDLSWIKQGQSVKVTAISFPAEEFSGKISAIDPVINPMTRSTRIRAKIDNPQLKLKPEMYVDIFIEAYLTDEEGNHKMALAIPQNALLDTGERKIVYLDLGKGEYLGKEVEAGPAASAYVNGQKQEFYLVAKGLKEGDRVVTRANFLIDSQSQISGAAAAAYGGALGAQEEQKPQHPTALNE